MLSTQPLARLKYGAGLLICHPRLYNSGPLHGFHHENEMLIYDDDANEEKISRPRRPLIRKIARSAAVG